MSREVPGPKARAFVGLPLAPELAAEVHARVQEALEARGAEQGFARPAPEDLHLTLVFLGTVERERLAVLGIELADALRTHAAPRLRLRAPGAFPARGRERVLWVGVEEPGTDGPGGRLELCRRTVLEVLPRAGCEVGVGERERFHAHVTVARARRARPGAGHLRAPEEFYRLGFDEPWNPREVVCFESFASPSRGERAGGRYRALTRIPLCAD